MCRFYRLHDTKKGGGAIQTPKAELAKYNKQGFGIFFTPNDFDGERKIANLKKINFWVADIDEGEKQEQMERINNLPMPPSTIIETKRGYHCYWRVEGVATLENYKDIELGLVERLKSDKQCTDVSRLLRCPGYYHLKDPKNPFLVKVVENNYKTYTEQKMLFCYKLKPKFQNVKKIDYVGDKSYLLDENNFEKIYHIGNIVEGCRNGELSKIAFRLRDSGFSREVVFNTIQRINQRISQPLGNKELQTIVFSKF